MEYNVDFKMSHYVYTEQWHCIPYCEHMLVFTIEHFYELSFVFIHVNKFQCYTLTLSFPNCLDARGKI